MEKPGDEIIVTICSYCGGDMIAGIAPTMATGEELNLHPDCAMQFARGLRRGARYCRELERQELTEIFGGSDATETG